VLIIQHKRRQLLYDGGYNARARLYTTTYVKFSSSTTTTTPTTTTTSTLLLLLLLPLLFRRHLLFPKRARDPPTTSPPAGPLPRATGVSPHSFASVTLRRRCLTFRAAFVHRVYITHTTTPSVRVCAWVQQYASKAAFRNITLRRRRRTSSVRESERRGAVVNIRRSRRAVVFVDGVGEQAPWVRPHRHCAGGGRVPEWWLDWGEWGWLRGVRRRCYIILL